MDPSNLENGELSALPEKVSAKMKDAATYYQSIGLTERYTDIMTIIERFNMWANSIGAFHGTKDSMSLAYRIRKAPKLKMLFCDILNDVLEDIDKLQFLTHSSENSLAQGKLFLDEAVTKRVFTGLRDSITSLFRASQVARYASKRDRFMEAQSRTFTHDDSNEDDLIAQLGELFPRLRHPGLMWLRRRLVKACSMRLRYLSYCRSHQERIRHGAMNAASEEISDDQSRATTASALGQQELDSALRDTGADGTESVLSYRTETRNDIRFRVLRLEEFLKDPDTREHKCPYCQVPQLLDRSKSNDELVRLWKRHVYDDIKPYVCTDEKCTVKMFSDNRLWLNHQCSEHLARWGCQYCEDRDHFESYQDFEHHMRKQHSIGRDDDKLQRWAKISEITLTRVPMTACPLCDWAQFYTARRITKGNHEEMVSDWKSVSLDRYRRHVGSHLEQIALGLLPEDYRDTLEDDSNDSSEEEAAPVGAIDTKEVEKKPGETEETEDERLDREIAEMEAREKEEEQREEAYLLIKKAEEEAAAPHLAAKAAEADRNLKRQEREAEELEFKLQRDRSLHHSKIVNQDENRETKALFASLKKPTIGPGAEENSEEADVEGERDRSIEAIGTRARAFHDSRGGGSQFAGLKRPIPRKEFGKGQRVMMEVKDSRKRTSLGSFVITDQKSISDGQWVYKLATSEGPLYAGGAWIPESDLQRE